jgi:hypothetical protein
MVTAPAPRAPLFPTANVPLLTVVPPEKPFAVASVSRPAPSLPSAATPKVGSAIMPAPPIV